MKPIDNDANELTYEEYVEEANKLKDEGWAGFKIYPPRAGVVYCKAYNKFLTEYRLITVAEYISLRDSGLWAKGIDRLKGTVATAKAKIAKSDPRTTKKAAKFDKVLASLILLHKSSIDNVDEYKTSLETIIRSMVNL